MLNPPPPWSSAGSAIAFLLLFLSWIILVLSQREQKCSVLSQCARVGVALSPSVTATFTANRLKSPPVIQLFTSDKPPSSARVAFSAMGTSAWVTVSSSMDDQLQSIQWTFPTNNTLTHVYHLKQHISSWYGKTPVQSQVDFPQNLLNLVFHQQELKEERWFMYL